MCQPQNIPLKPWESTILNKPGTLSTKAAAPNSEVLLTAVSRRLTNLPIQKFQNVMQKADNNLSDENNFPSPFKNH